MKRGDGLRTDMPAGYDYEAILSQVLLDLQPVRWRIPSDFLQRSHFERVVMDLEFTSSPGVPYLYSCPTTAQMFGYKNGEIDPVRLEQVWFLVSQRLRDRISDPIRCFIKAEPHKLKKLDKGAYRLIASVSVVDQIIDSMLFGELNDLIVGRYMDTPIKVGWSPYVGGWKIMPCSGVVATDASSWDWTVRPWLLQMELDVRSRLCDNLTSEWLDLARWRYRELFVCPVWQTSNGWMLRQRHPGVMKSGCVNTITSNSIMQLILHYRVARELGQEAQPLFVMGDDVLQWPQSDMDAYLKKKSEYCIIKSAASVPEFAGHRFCGWNVEPLYLGKHAFSLLHLNEKYAREIVASYALLYHRSAKRDSLRKMLAHLGEPLPELPVLDMIYDGE